MTLDLLRRIWSASSLPTTIATKQNTNAYVIGLDSLFIVLFATSYTVGVLKEPITMEKEPELSHIAADRLELDEPDPVNDVRSLCSSMSSYGLNK